jgi:hypothetical protein
MVQNTKWAVACIAAQTSGELRMSWYHLRPTFTTARLGRFEA